MKYASFNEPQTVRASLAATAELPDSLRQKGFANDLHWPAASQHRAFRL